MKHEIRKISKIADELITFCLKHDAKKVSVDIEDLDTKYVISLKVDNVNRDSEIVNMLEDLLNYPRYDDMEEYYWSLAGESDHDTELSLVGSMVDDADVKFENHTLSIKLVRIKAHERQKIFRKKRK